LKIKGFAVLAALEMFVRQRPLQPSPLKVMVSPEECAVKDSDNIVFGENCFRRLA
jgi:hypothetical protein